MEEQFHSRISDATGIHARQVAAVLSLLGEGATIPFIARYRKERTGNLDEQQITDIRDQDKKLRELEARRETILKSIEDQGKLTPELKSKILAADSLPVLEDLYLPYKPKRRTRAMIAREKGLEPLALLLLEQKGDPVAAAKKFINPEMEIDDTESALAGARDIIAEMVSEDEIARKRIRRLFERQGVLSAKVIKGKEAEGANFRDWFEWEENALKAPAHRVLAMRRGEQERILRLNIAPPEDEALHQLSRIFIHSGNAAAQQVQMAVEDSYKRLLAPSIETEIRLKIKEKADEKAIQVFADNLRELLMAAPLGQKGVIAIDPGFRTGCKVVALSPDGSLLADDVIYPHPPQKQAREAQAFLKAWAEKFQPAAIAIGNGTAGRETEQLVRDMKLPGIQVIMVNEAGASIYSASEIARKEFPHKDVTVRGAVSIGRRLQDPLAELVKIDPKSIGVGQYQHDVNQKLLKDKLDEVVMSAVNQVGVELNTASAPLLSYVSGIGPTLAGNIVKFRSENEGFKSRKDLLKVSGLGPKAFEQSAGFLRIRHAKNPLDRSAVHPESYKIVEKMAKDAGTDVEQLMKDGELRKKISAKDYVSGDVGLPTIKDILSELEKPGRDPREAFEAFSFAEGINDIADIREGMELPGIVTNVTAFGAFVDIGIKENGLVHISEMADKYISDPNEVVKVNQQVRVRVLEVDMNRKRIALSMKGMGR